MKKILLTLLMITVAGIHCNSILAQEGDVYVSLFAGASIPLAEYAEAEFSNPGSGFARAGGNFGVNFGYRFNEYISLSGMLNGSVNRYDYIKLQDWFNENLAELERSWVVETKSWGLGGLLAGITGSLPLVTNTLYLDARALGGFTYVYSPAIYISGIDKKNNSEDIYINIEQYSSGSWALDFGAGLRYNRNRKQYFTLYADYFMANPNYSGVKTESNTEGEIRSEAFSQKINAVNISFGIGYIVN